MLKTSLYYGDPTACGPRKPCLELGWNHDISMMSFFFFLMQHGYIPPDLHGRSLGVDLKPYRVLKGRQVKFNPGKWMWLLN